MPWRWLPGFTGQAVAVDNKLRPRVELFVALNAATYEHAGAWNGVIGIDDGGGLVAVVREFGRLNRLYQSGIFLFCRRASGDVLHHANFSCQQRAIPVFIAKLIIIQN